MNDGNKSSSRSIRIENAYTLSLMTSRSQTSNQSFTNCSWRRHRNPSILRNCGWGSTVAVAYTFEIIFARYGHEGFTQGYWHHQWPPSGHCLVLIILLQDKSVCSSPLPSVSLQRQSPPFFPWQIESILASPPQKEDGQALRYQTFFRTPTILSLLRHVTHFTATHCRCIN